MQHTKISSSFYHVIVKTEESLDTWLPYTLRRWWVQLSYTVGLKNVVQCAKILEVIESPFWWESALLQEAIGVNVFSGVVWQNLGKLKTCCAAALWMSCNGHMIQRGRPARICSTPVLNWQEIEQTPDWEGQSVVKNYSKGNASPGIYSSSVLWNH